MLLLSFLPLFLSALELSCDISLGNVICDGNSCTCNNDNNHNENVQILTLTGSTSANYVFINNSELDFVFSDVKMDFSYFEFTPISISNSKVTFKIKGVNKVQQFSSIGPAIECANESSLLFEQHQDALDEDYLYVEGASKGAGIGTGLYSGRCKSLTFNSGNIQSVTFGNGAGIGTGQCSPNFDCSIGNITINGGNIYARGPRENLKDGAGIGVGFNGIVDCIVINDGNVTAHGNYASGIGGGFYGKISSIIINGGKINATTSVGAGIGAGYHPQLEHDIYENNTMDSIIINNGDIYAQGYFGAAIGSGYNSNLKDLIINNGTIVAIAEDARWSYASGIGAGNDAECQNIQIHGGNIIAHGCYGAGIGSGLSSNVDVLNITGGSITSNATYSSGIGAGGGHNNGKGSVDKIFISGGWINASGHMGAGIGAGYGDSINASSVNTIDISGGTIYAKGVNASGIGGSVGFSNLTSNVKEIIIRGGVIIAEGDTGIGGGSNPEKLTGIVQNIKISGGQINASGLYSGIGAGIGTLLDSLEISNGEINAWCTLSGPAIGGAANSKIKEILITGGHITADARSTTDNSHGGPGIGVGSSYLSESIGYSVSWKRQATISNIEIKNGTVIAIGSGYGAGIGGGDSLIPSDSYIENITITGGEISAEGGEYGAAIGGGYDSSIGTIRIDVTGTTQNSCAISLIGGSKANEVIGKGYNSSVSNIYINRIQFNCDDKRCTSYYIEETHPSKTTIGIIVGIAVGVIAVVIIIVAIVIHFVRKKKGHKGYSKPKEDERAEKLGDIDESNQ